MAMRSGLLENVWSRIAWIAGVITFLVSAIWAALTYSHGNRLAFEKPLIDKQIALCFEISTVVGTLASTNDAALFDRKRQEFLGYYWGPLNMVEGREVETAMSAMKEKLEAGGFDKRSELGFYSRDMVRKCRKQIETIISERWRIGLSDVLGIDF